MLAQFKVSCLKSAVTAVSGIVPSRTTKDILKSVKLSIQPDGATILASDSEVSIIHPVAECICEVPGEVLFPCDKLISILREVTDDVLKMEVDDRKAKMACGSWKLTIPLQDAAEFQECPKFESDKFYRVSAGDLSRVIRMSVCSSEEQNKSYTLAGVQLNLGDKLIAATTDSRSLTVTPVPCSRVGYSSDDPAEHSVVVPKEGLKLVSGILLAGDVDILPLTNTVFIRHQGAVVSMQQIGGRFPDWRRVVPEKVNHIVDIVAAPMASAIRQCLITTNPETSGIDFRFGKGILSMSSSGVSVGESCVELPISFDGNVDIRLASERIQRAVKLFDGGSVMHFGLIDEDSPIKITDDSGFVYIQMPMVKK